MFNLAGENVKNYRKRQSRARDYILNSEIREPMITNIQIDIDNSVHNITDFSQNNLKLNQNRILAVSFTPVNDNFMSFNQQKYSNKYLASSRMQQKRAHLSSKGIEQL